MSLWQFELTYICTELNLHFQSDMFYIMLLYFKACATLQPTHSEVLLYVNWKSEVAKRHQYCFGASPLLLPCRLFATWWMLWWQMQQSCRAAPLLFNMSHVAPGCGGGGRCRTPGCITPRRNSLQRSLPWHCFAASVVVVLAGRIAVGDVCVRAHQACGNCTRHLILH